MVSLYRVDHRHLAGDSTVPDTCELGLMESAHSYSYNISHAMSTAAMSVTAQMNAKSHITILHCTQHSPNAQFYS